MLSGLLLRAKGGASGKGVRHRAGDHLPNASLVHRRYIRDPDDEALARDHPGDRLAPRLLTRRVDELEAGPFELLGGGRDGVRALDVELDARLRARAVGRPVGVAEACLGGLPERPHAEVPGSLNLLAVQVLLALVCGQRETERVDVELAARVDVWRDHGEAGHEFHVHGAAGYGHNARLA